MKCLNILQCDFVQHKGDIWVIVNLVL